MKALIRSWRMRRTIKNSGLFYHTYYKAQVQDSVDSDLIKHYMRHGAKAGLAPNPLFDSAWYLSTYPDVAAAGMNPLYHYIQHGAAEGRNPGPEFSTYAYLRKHPDVHEAGINPLLHYLKHGAAEGRP